MVKAEAFPGLTCRCKNKHQWDAIVPWWEFNLRDLICEECGETAESVRFFVYTNARSKKRIRRERRARA